MAEANAPEKRFRLRVQPRFLRQPLIVLQICDVFEPNPFVRSGSSHFVQWRDASLSDLPISLSVEQGKRK